MIPANQIILLSPKTLDWFDLSKLDYERDADAIICAAFDWGSLEDLAEAWAYYGRERTINALTNAVILRKSTVNFAASLFKLSESAFRSAQNERPQPNLNCTPASVNLRGERGYR